MPYNQLIQYLNRFICKYLLAKFHVIHTFNKIGYALLKRDGWIFIINYLLEMLHAQMINKKYYVVECKSRERLYFLFTFRKLVNAEKPVDEHSE